jgi:hypothetical protein
MGSDTAATPLDSTAQTAGAAKNKYATQQPMQLATLNGTQKERRPVKLRAKRRTLHEDLHDPAKLLPSSCTFPSSGCLTRTWRAIHLPTMPHVTQRSAPQSQFTFARLQRRVSAAVWFAGVGFIVAAAMFAVPAFRRGPTSVILYLVLPTLSGGLAGYLSGSRLLRDPSGSVWWAAIHGLVVSVEALVIFSLLFTVTYELTSGRMQNPVGLFFGALVVGGLSAGAVILLAGVLGGILLSRMSVK